MTFLLTGNPEDDGTLLHAHDKRLSTEGEDSLHSFFGMDGSERSTIPHQEDGKNNLHHELDMMVCKPYRLHP